MHGHSRLEYAVGILPLPTGEKRAAGQDAKFGLWPRDEKVSLILLAHGDIPHSTRYTVTARPNRGSQSTIQQRMAPTTKLRVST